MTANEDIDLAIAALQACKVFREAYGSAPPSPDRIQEVVTALAAGDPPVGRFGGIRTCVADAISRAFLNQDMVQPPG